MPQFSHWYCGEIIILPQLCTGCLDLCLKSAVPAPSILSHGVFLNSLPSFLVYVLADELPLPYWFIFIQNNYRVEYLLQASYCFPQVFCR